MFLLSVFLIIWLTSFQIADSWRRKEESIQPVNMSYIYVHEEQPDTDWKKPPVLLIHGVTSSKKTWNGFHQNLTLRTNRPLYLIDLRNHGDSPWSDRVDVAALTVDIENFLDQQGIKHLDIIGHSLGGKIAMHLAVKHPSRVSSIVVEDMRPNGLTFAGVNFLRAGLVLNQVIINKVPDESSEEEAKQIIVDAIHSPILKFARNDLFREDELEIRQVNGKWMWKYNKDVISKALKDIDEFLGICKGNYSGRTLFIYGTMSPMGVGRDKKNIMKMFPNAEIIPVKGASHKIHVNFQQFEDKVVEFLNGN